jgi:membrane fusion protein, multidrug efflux system
VSALRKALGVLVSLIALGGVLVTGVLVSRQIDQRPRTDDAYLQAYIVHMAPDVSGRIVELNVRDNQKVQRGQVLFRIDPDPYKLRVDQASAAVRGLEATLAVSADQVASQTSKADAAASAINAAEAQTALATSTLARIQPLLKSGFVTAQQVDQARTAQRSAQVALEQARLQAAEARQGITSTKPIEAELRVRRSPSRSVTWTRQWSVHPAMAESLRSKSPPASLQAPGIRSSPSSTPSSGMRSAISVRRTLPGSHLGSLRPSM